MTATLYVLKWRRGCVFTSCDHIKMWHSLCYERDLVGPCEGNIIVQLDKQDLTRFNKTAIQGKGPDGKLTRKAFAYRESNIFHLCVTRHTEMCVKNSPF